MEQVKLTLDEVHALVDNRRGVQLMTSLERLVALAGEFSGLLLQCRDIDSHGISRDIEK